ncbi:hypothetical protein ANABIO32_44890 [Rossellomorea marisflavi]|uniref:TIGR03826 family flagellar region protein n=1 Tax=Rossellomorea marisflavi TaxID=189381 RepID=UPI0025C92F18|nr:TIGR03826 family flagellar region protein [Rossellomorea marisflavi]GLI86642.1 hypothetical protein ANABIO32_44890 [Rossellomorea marisflavi]
MSEVNNCPRCNALFMQTRFREVCEACHKAEETLFETVIRFLKKRENRAASIARVVDVTGVEEELLHNWVRKGRIQSRQFPNMGYPCDRCGKIIHSARICEGCQTSLIQDLKQHESDEQWKQSIKESGHTYYTRRKEK